MHDQDLIAHNFEKIIDRIAIAAGRVGRNPADINLVAVTKKQSLERVKSYLDLLRSKGQLPIIGENYVQEYKRKIDQLGNHLAHMIGPLQSNKVKDAVAVFELIESVHSERILDLISKEAKKIGKIQKIFLEVNVSNDPAKSGFALDQVKDVVDRCLSLSNILLIGLMTITFQYDHAEEARPDFKCLRCLRDELAEKLPLVLSMGMSQDFEVAIEEGADIIRLGSMLFGERI